MSAIEAPNVRLVNALTGQKAPDKFMAALSEADDFVREIDTVRELQCRIDELTAERNDLAERLRDLSETHQATLDLLADARRGKTEEWHGTTTGGGLK